MLHFCQEYVNGSYFFRVCLIPLFHVIADAPPCPDIGGICRVIFDLCPQSADADINGPGFDECLFLPDGFEELLAAEYTAAPLGKIEQQLEFRRAQAERTPRFVTVKVSVLIASSPRRIVLSVVRSPDLRKTALTRAIDSFGLKGLVM